MDSLRLGFNKVQRALHCIGSIRIYSGQGWPFYRPHPIKNRQIHECASWVAQSCSHTFLLGLGFGVPGVLGFWALGLGFRVLWV